MAAPERFAERQILLLHRGRRPYMAQSRHTETDRYLSAFGGNVLQNSIALGDRVRR